MITRPVLCRSYVGRKDELAYLHERRLEAGASHGCVVLISGDAGLGKSRLIAEFDRSLAYSRWRVAIGRCLEIASRPYAPILEILERLDGRPFELGGAASQREQFDAIFARVVAIAERTALALVFEDLHWADAATLDFLDYFSARIGRMRVMVVASFRPSEPHPGHTTTAALAKIERTSRAGRIDLAPLEGTELWSFIDDALDSMTLPESIRRDVALVGEGNPFFTEELLKGAVERLAKPGERRTGELPRTVRETLLERLRPFDERERAIITQAAVVGRTFRLELLAQTLDVEPATLLEPLRRARDYQIVEEVSPALFRFRHALTREAIYDEFLAAEIQPRHRLIARALESAPAEERSLDALAYHWWAAGDGEPAARYNELAGDAASAIHAHEDAIVYYERVLSLPGIGPFVRGTIHEKLAERRFLLGRTVEMQASYAAAADCFRDARTFEREATCRVSAAISAYLLDMKSPTSPLEDMLARLDESEFVARSRIHLGIAWLAATFWEPTTAERHMAAVDPRALDDAADIRLKFHNISAWIAMTIGDTERFVRDHAAWVSAATAISPMAVAAAHYNGALCFTNLALHDAAREEIRRALAVAAESHNHYARACAILTSVMCNVLAGDLTLARRALDEVSVTTENRIHVMSGCAGATTLGAYTGDEALVAKWFDRYEAIVLASPESESAGGCAEILVRRGRWDDAAALLARSLHDCERMRGDVPTFLAVAKYCRAPERTRVRAMLARSADAPSPVPEQPALALFDAYCASREGRPEEAIHLAREAASGFERLAFPLLAAAAFELAGERAEALVLYRRCGATADVARLEAESAAPARAEHREDPLRLLTAREREVATRAAIGKTNVAIAGDLSISHKTVEKHLAAAYTKLGVTSRAGLGARLA